MIDATQALFTPSFFDNLTYCSSRHCSSCFLSLFISPLIYMVDNVFVRIIDDTFAITDMPKPVDHPLGAIERASSLSLPYSSSSLHSHSSSGFTVSSMTEGTSTVPLLRQL